MSPALLRADSAAARPAALDLHEGIDDPLAHGCQRWPEELRLLNVSTGELRPGRCRATNLCPYCARLFAVETSEMLLLDAMEDAPTLYAVLTAREFLDHRELRRHLSQLRKSLRKRWPEVRWAVLREYQRRGALHVNLLVKGVPRDERDEFHAAWTSVWCARVDAEELGQYTGAVADQVGLAKYVTLHFMKEAQAPGIGWRGHRYSATRDYLVRPASVMRVEARRSLQLKRLLWRGRSLEDAELELAAASSSDWTMRRVAPSTIELRPAYLRRGGGNDEPSPSPDARARDAGSVDSAGAVHRVREPLHPRRAIARERRAVRHIGPDVPVLPDTRLARASRAVSAPLPAPGSPPG